MNLYFSLGQVPELAGLSSTHRRLMMMCYLQRQPVTPRSRRTEGVFVTGVILAEIAGFVIGPIIWRNEFWGPVAGAAIMMAFVMCLFHFANNYFVAPEFRRFLNTDAGRFMLRSVLTSMPSHKTLPSPVPEVHNENPGRYRTREGTPISAEGVIEALKKVTYDGAHSSEVMELSGQLSNESLRLFDCAKLKNREALRALKWFRFARCLRLHREGAGLRAQAFQSFWQATELFQRAEASLGRATALLEELKDQFRDDESDRSS